MKTIMLATESSERSEQALHRAALLFWQFGASLSIDHVLEDDQPRRFIDSARDATSAFLRKLRNTAQNVDGMFWKTKVVLACSPKSCARPRCRSCTSLARRGQSDHETHPVGGCAKGISRG